MHVILPLAMPGIVSGTAIVFSLATSMYVIPSLLITNLENTGLFKVSTWERMRDVLGQIGRKGVDIVDGDAGFDFCRREGVAYIVVGSFSKAGETFVTEFKLLDPETRKIVATAADLDNQGIEPVVSGGRDQLLDLLRRSQRRTNNPQSAYLVFL